MKTLLKLIISIAVALIISSLFASISSSTDIYYIYSAATYLFLMVMVYGLWIYGPFIVMHYVFFNYFTRYTWWTSISIGGALAIIIVFALVSGSDPIIIITPIWNKMMTIFSFGIGGGLYGLLYYFWIDRPPHTKLW